MDAVIVTFNSAEELRRLAVSEPGSTVFGRVIVVDNASTDETCEIAAASGFVVRRLAVNHGFAFAANVGARQTRGPCFALLNPDVRFAGASDLGRLASHLEADPQVAVVAPGLILPSGALQDSARRVPTPWDLLVRRFSDRQPDAIRGGRPTDVEWAVAACLVVRRNAFEAVGGLDPRYFLYFEDVDFGVRLRRAGYKLRYDPTVRAFHDHGAASRASLRSRATRIHVRSAIRFYAQHPDHLWRVVRNHQLNG